jgi:hypothetical protein
MLAFRSSKATIALGRSFSTNSRPALRAAAFGGRPRAGSATTAPWNRPRRGRLAEGLYYRPTMSGTAVQVLA